MCGLACEVFLVHPVGICSLYLYFKSYHYRTLAAYHLIKSNINQVIIRGIARSSCKYVCRNSQQRWKRVSKPGTSQISVGCK